MADRLGERCAVLKACWKHVDSKNTSWRRRWLQFVHENVLYGHGEVSCEAWPGSRTMFYECVSVRSGAQNDIERRDDRIARTSASSGRVLCHAHRISARQGMAMFAALRLVGKTLRASVRNVRH